MRSNARMGLHWITGRPFSHRLGHAHVSTTTDIYSHVIKQAEERISDCVANVILKPTVHQAESG